MKNLNLLLKKWKILSLFWILTVLGPIKQEIIGMRLKYHFLVIFLLVFCLIVILKIDINSSKWVI